MNNQTFELKDAYLADFESKLDAYNKKGKGLVWLLFGGVVLFTCFYDFLILPNFNNKQTYSIEKVTPFLKNKSENSTSKSVLPTTNSSSDDVKENKNDKTIISSISNTQNSSDITHANSKNRSTSNDVLQNKNQIQTTVSSNRNNDLTKNTTALKPEINSTITDSVTINSNTFDSTTTLPTIKEEIKPVVVYIDDTIRRKVVIVDTVVINDTIKNKIRLFKKKR